MEYDEKLTDLIKKYAVDQDVDLIGIASVDRFEGAPEGFHPTDLLGATQSVIVTARTLLSGILDELSPERQRLSYKHHMFAHLNTLNTLTAYELGRFLEKKGYKAFVVQPTTPYYAQELRGVMSHRHAAVRAGLGVFGKSNLVLTKEFGPRQRFCTVLTDAKLRPNPMIQGDLCQECLACRNVCPVQAWDSESGKFYKPVCARHQKWNRADQECKEPCGLCIQVCPLGKEHQD
jgi:epoxyqueuosine reductase